MAKVKIILVVVFVIFFSFRGYLQDDCITRVANDYVGVREATGNNDGEIVELFLASANAKKGDPWCAAFVTYVHSLCGYKIPNSPAWSPSWFPTSRIVKLSECESGDVFGIYYSSKKRIAHVGIIEKETGNYFLTIEGNTNEAGSREGDGVYKKRRPQKTIYKIARWKEMN